jgi:hypothetical protein
MWTVQQIRILLTIANELRGITRRPLLNAHGHFLFTYKEILCEEFNKRSSSNLSTEQVKRKFFGIRNWFLDIKAKRRGVPVDWDLYIAVFDDHEPVEASMINEANFKRFSSGATIIPQISQNGPISKHLFTMGHIYLCIYIFR